MSQLRPPEGVPDWAWASIARREGERWAIPERSATGEVIGTAFRDAGGRKGFDAGGARGIIVAWPLCNYAGTSVDSPVFVCEGASDTAALLGLGLDAVGVPMAGHCSGVLHELLRDRHVVIVVDADEAGRRGGRRIGDALISSCASVRIIEPPGGVKDARAAVIAGHFDEAFLAAASVATRLQATSAPADGAPVIVRLCEVQPEPVAWLWPGRFALGKLTLLAGDPGLGKSFVTLDMASRVSAGTGWPDVSGERMRPAGVVLLSAEDAIGDTIRPRLDAAGADVSRIVALEAIRSVGADGRECARAFNLSRDLAALEAAIRLVTDCRLVVIDPVTAYLSGVDSHKNAEIRGLLAQLGELATRHQVAIVAVTHLNKTGGGPAIYRAMGSLAFAAAARAAWAVSKDKDDPIRRLLLPMKNNLAPDMGGLAYRIEPMGVDGCPVVVWEPDPVTVTADDALAVERYDCNRRTETDDAADWLTDFLQDGPRSATEVMNSATAAGFSRRTIHRAKPLARIRTRKGGFDSGWTWDLGTPPRERQSEAEGFHVPEVGNLGS